MKRHCSLVLFLTVSLAVFLSSSCRVPPPNSNPSGLVECAIQGVRDQAFTALPKVNSALTGGDWRNSLFSLIADFGENVIACTLGLTNRMAASSIESSPNDELSKLRYQRSSAFIEERGYKFK